MFSETHFIFMLFETIFVFMLFALMLFGNSPFENDEGIFSVSSSQGLEMNNYWKSNCQ